MSRGELIRFKSQSLILQVASHRGCVHRFKIVSCYYFQINIAKIEGHREKEDSRVSSPVLHPFDCGQLCSGRWNLPRGAWCCGGIMLRSQATRGGCTPSCEYPSYGTMTASDRCARRDEPRPDCRAWSVSDCSWGGKSYGHRHITICASI